MHTATPAAEQRRPTLPQAARRFALASALAAASVAASLPAAHAEVLSDNTGTEMVGIVTATGNDWVGASFVTVATSGLSQIQATLLGSTASGSPTLALYSSDASTLIPESALATFTAADSEDGSLSFVLDNYELTADTTYWIVLTNTEGSTDWNWTFDSTGSGAGFTANWAGSDDAGITWYTNSQLYPLQFAVSVAAVPEPANAVLLLVAGAGLLGWRRKQQAAGPRQH